MDYTYRMMHFLLFASLLTYSSCDMVTIDGPQTFVLLHPCTLCVCLCVLFSVWNRIPFAGACLAISTSIIQQYPGVVWLSFASVFMAFIWYMIWGSGAMGYVLSADGEVNQVIWFLLLISLYWGAQVCMNVSHTTTWYLIYDSVVEILRILYPCMLHMSLYFVFLLLCI